MRILFIGDSITKGTQGVDWVRMISRKHQDWKVENAGLNGETINKTSDRLVLKLAQNDYDVVVFECGYNDVMLPTFVDRQGWFPKAYQHQLKLGNTPSNLQQFEHHLRESVDYMVSVSKVKVVLTTLGCINESNTAVTNLKAREYNKVIRKVAKEYNCALADVEERFASYLNQRSTSDYLMEIFINTAFLDAINCIIRRADHLSETRGLHLTIDGVHLNTKGALIFKEEVEKLLINIDDKVPLYI